MRVSIFPSENLVTIDGRSATVDLSRISPNYQVISWDAGRGEIQTTRGENLPLRNMKSFNFAVDAALAIFATEDAPPSIDVVRQQRVNEVNELLGRKLKNGVDHNGRRLQLDSAGQMAAEALAALVAKLGFAPWKQKFWRMADNKPFVLANPDDMIGLFLTAQAENQRLRKVAWGHKDSLARLQTIHELDDYDITAGW